MDVDATEEVELCRLQPLPSPLRAGYTQRFIAAVSDDVWIDRFVVHRHAGRVRMREAAVGTVTVPFDSERQRLLTWPGRGYLAGGMIFSVEVEAIEDSDLVVSVFGRRRKGSDAHGWQQDPETGHWNRGMVP